MFKKKKSELLQTDTLLFVGNLISNTRERNFMKHEVIKDDIAIAIEYTNALNNFHQDIETSLRLINGLPILDDSFLMTGVLPDNSIDTYAYESILWNGVMETKPIGSNIFKGRFIMNMLISIDNNFINILMNELKSIGKKKNNREALSLIYQIRHCLGNFIVALTNDNTDYRNELSKICELISMSGSEYSKHTKKTIGIVNRELDRLIDMTNPGFLDGKRPSDDVFIQNICLCAYVLATGHGNVKNTFMVPEETKLSDHNSIKYMVEILGSCIINKRNDLIPYPEVYRWFLQSLPKVYYRYNDINYNKCLVEGCRALSFVNFFASNKSVNKLISKMIY